MDSKDKDAFLVQEFFLGNQMVEAGLRLSLGSGWESRREPGAGRVPEGAPRPSSGQRCLPPGGLAAEGGLIRTQPSGAGSLPNGHRRAAAASGAPLWVAARGERG